MLVEESDTTGGWASLWAPFWNAFLPVRRVGAGQRRGHRDDSPVQADERHLNLPSAMARCFPSGAGFSGMLRSRRRSGN